MSRGKKVVEFRGHKVAQTVKGFRESRTAVELLFLNVLGVENMHVISAYTKLLKGIDKNTLESTNVSNMLAGVNSELSKLVDKHNSLLKVFNDSKELEHVKSASVMAKFEVLNESFESDILTGSSLVSVSDKGIKNYISVCTDYVSGCSALMDGLNIIGKDVVKQSDVLDSVSSRIEVLKVRFKEGKEVISSNNTDTIELTHKKLDMFDNLLSLANVESVVYGDFISYLDSTCTLLIDTFSGVEDVSEKQSVLVVRVKEVLTVVNNTNITKEV